MEADDLNKGSEDPNDANKIKNERTQQTSPNRVACKAIKAKGREEKNSASPQVLLKNEIFIGQRAAPAIWLCSSPLQGASESACARPFW